MDEQNQNKQTYEQAVERLSQIVKLLESGKASLDESIRLFEEGSELVKVCTSLLETAEQKVISVTDSEANAK